MDDVQKRMEELYKLIAYHSERYYNQDDPEISDFEYDKLNVELRTLEAQYPLFAHADTPTQRVGGKAGNRRTRRDAGTLNRHAGHVPRPRRNRLLPFWAWIPAHRSRL